MWKKPDYRIKTTVGASYKRLALSVLARTIPVTLLCDGQGCTYE